MDGFSPPLANPGAGIPTAPCPATPGPASVLAIGPPGRACHDSVAHLLSRHGLSLRAVPARAPIPGTHWGEPEAGIMGTAVHARPDTPAHSVLHEACHVICMDPARRDGLHTDAGGSALEECAVCYLSIVLSDRVDGFGRDRMLVDMDAWGYSFRLGSARAWFEADAGDALAWLQSHALLDARGAPTWRLRC